jgi:guanine deaminase
MQNPFLLRAFELARQNIQSGGGGPFAALVVRHGEVIAEGVNRVTTTNDPTAHAEVVAIRQACQNLQSFQLEGCEIYCTCEPCPMCLAAIYWARASRIVFGASREDAAAAGFDDEWIYREIPLPAAERAIPATQELRAEALGVFEEWSENDRKISY